METMTRELALREPFRTSMRAAGHLVPCLNPDCARMAVGKAEFCCKPCGQSVGLLTMIELHDAMCELHDECRG